MGTSASPSVAPAQSQPPCAACAPGNEEATRKRGEHGQGETCYKLSDLRKIDAWTRGSRKGGERGTTFLPPTSEKHRLLRVLRDRFRTTCGGDEACWMKEMSKRAPTRRMRRWSKRVQRQRFRPERPSSWIKNPNQWLSTVDIQRVLEQYEQKYPYFVFLGVFPIDFNEPSRRARGGGSRCRLDSPLCMFRYSMLNKWVSAKRMRSRRVKGGDGLDNAPAQIGLVLNLDHVGEKGSHWVAVFGDMQRHELIYYDSNGKGPPTEAKRLLDMIKKEHDKAHLRLQRDGGAPKLRIRWNDVKHQFHDTECGVYAMHFIISMLENPGGFDMFQKTTPGDREIMKLRCRYFNCGGKPATQRVPMRTRRRARRRRRGGQAAGAGRATRASTSPSAKT